MKPPKTTQYSPHYMKRYLLVLFLSFPGILSTIYAQDIQLGPESRISVLTCGPGSDLYSKFGHTAFRVQDAALGLDWVYNYGTFDFDQPNFYLKFARGQLDYALSRQQFPNFLYTYQLESRWVREQWLDLDASERQEVFEFLEENYRPENRFYKYSFLRENCATKIPDILQQSLGDDLFIASDQERLDKTFRDLIQSNLYTNSWSSFGIDLALGARIDRKATAKERQFLPEFVMEHLADAQYNGKPLIAYDRVVLDLESRDTPLYFTATPLFWLLVLFVLTVAITWIDFKNKSRSRLMDGVLFLLTGLAGIFLFLLWFFTDHQDTVWNANLLWAFPVNAYLGYLLLARKSLQQWVALYLKCLIGAMTLCAVLWLFGLQVFSPLVLVIWLTLLVRIVFLLHHKKSKN